MTGGHLVLRLGALKWQGEHYGKIDQGAHSLTRPGGGGAIDIRGALRRDDTRPQNILNSGAGGGVTSCGGPLGALDFPGGLPHLAQEAHPLVAAGSGGGHLQDSRDHLHNRGDHLHGGGGVPHGGCHLGNLLHDLVQQTNFYWLGQDLVLGVMPLAE